MYVAKPQKVQHKKKLVYFPRKEVQETKRRLRRVEEKKAACTD